MGKPQLVLDVAGVLITNMSPSFWKLLSDDSGISYDVFLQRFKVDARVQLWTGAIAEVEFWRWLGNTFPAISVQNARLHLKSSLQPLPAMDYLARWSEIADLHLLTNHRTEWLSRLLAPVRKYISTVTISSDVGYCKPQREIYDLVADKLDTDQPILFVDDQEKNLRTAIDLGWNTLQADELGTWVRRVEPLLLRQYYPIRFTNHRNTSATNLRGSQNLPDSVSKSP